MAAVLTPVAPLSNKGTLTEGNFNLVGSCGIGNRPEADVWELIAAVQLKSTHPIATALVRHATGCVTEAYDEAEAAGTQQLPVSGFENIPGTGVTGKVGLPDGSSRTVLLGNRKVLEHAVKLAPEFLTRLETFERQSDGGTVIFVVVDGVVEMAVALADTIRAGSYGAVAALQSKRIETVMLTGDRKEAAQRVCSELGINDFKASLKPEDKLGWIKERVAQGRSVVMIGDGMNDGPSLSAATVGIAMGAGGTAMAVESASVVMLRDELLAIPYLVELSVLCKLRIRQNIGAAVLIKLIFVVLALTDTLTKLWVAVLVDAVSILLVMANSRRGIVDMKETETEPEPAAKTTVV